LFGDSANRSLMVNNGPLVFWDMTLFANTQVCYLAMTFAQGEMNGRRITSS
jgi:hypothetical protein